MFEVVAFAILVFLFYVRVSVSVYSLRVIVFGFACMFLCGVGVSVAL